MSRDADCMALLKNLSRDQILEVLSQGLLCDHCDEALKSRALRFVAKSKVTQKLWNVVLILAILSFFLGFKFLIWIFH